MFHSNLGWNIQLLSPQHVRIRFAWTLEWGDIMEVYSCGNRKLFTLDQAHVMTIATSTKIVPNACILCHLVIFIIKSKPISKWIVQNWASHTHYGLLRWTLVLFKGFTTCLIRLESFLHTSVSLSPVDKRNQTNNPRKRNSPLNTRAQDIRVEVPLVSLKSPFVICYM